MEKLKFLLGVTFQPPLHYSQHELEEYYQSAVKPFLALTYRFPDIPLTLFFTGPFLEWLKEHHSEYLTALTEMIKRKQVEILGGGYFAPLLPLIPPTDRVGQIEELTTLVRRLLGKRPRGLWLTRTVWDPSLVVHLNGSGMEYTFLEEEDFRRIGISEDLLPYPRVTENQGKLITVFPVQAKLCQQIQDGDFGPFQDEARRRALLEDSLLSIFFSVENLVDGEFFTRPGNGFEAFLELVRSLYPEMEGVNPSSFFKKNTRPLRRSYFASTTYEELCKRTDLPLRPSAAAQSWRQFLTDFEPSNRLYSKMIYVHLLVSSLRGDKYKKKAAYEDLWRAQNSSAFFPVLEFSNAGVTNRQKAFVSLLTAEALLRDKAHFTSSLTAQDFDLDGVNEYLYQGKRFNFYVDPVGGQIFEWDCLEKPWNYVGENWNSDELRLPHVFVDRFFRIDRPNEDAAFFYNHEYRLSELSREQKVVQMWAVETIQGFDGLQPVRLKKTYQFADSVVHLDYEIELLSGPSWEGWFSSESSISFPSPDHVLFAPIGAENESTGGTGVDRHRDLTMTWTWSPAAAWTQTRHEVSQTSLVPIYLSHRLAPRWWMILHPGQPWSCRMTLSLK